jgi:uncharacterized protein (UPF0333 family)
MNKNTMYLLVAVLVIVIIVAGAAAYILMGNGGSGTNATPTPAPTTVPTVVGASTLQINVDETGSAGTVTYMFSAKNMNTGASNLVVRMDIPGGSAGNYTYIVDEGAQKAYSSFDNGATWTSDDWPTDYAMVITPFNDYVTHLADNWNGSDLTYTYTSSTGTILIYDICPNPTLSDSLFSTS